MPAPIRPVPTSSLKRLPGALAAGWWLASAGALAQTPPESPQAETPAGSVSPVPMPDKGGAADASQKIEINGNKLSDTELRRRSTAAKIIVGREELEKFGDATVGELLKRLPGVTIGGTPGRGGQIRMRGLGNGYTQILLDGERVQGGLSLDSLDPDQIERIEIIRAPTAETGGRAIGGTLNIITREGFTKKLNDLKASLSYENGRLQPQASWSRADKLGDFDYNINLGVNRRDTDDRTLVHTVNPDDDRTEVQSARSQRNGVNLNGRLQWRLGGGDTLMLMPMVIHSKGESERHSEFEPGVIGRVPFTASESHSDSTMTLGRLNGQYKGQLGEGRLEVRGGLGRSRNNSHTVREELGSEDSPDGSPLNYDNRGKSEENSANLNAKYTLTLENDHNIVSGLELDKSRRKEVTQYTGDLSSTDETGDNFRARVQRLAAYSQDEWTINPNWSAYAGLRWEGITTHGEGDNRPESDNKSSVWTPLLHAVWKPDPKGQDQVRMSLTRSYRSPTLGNLIRRAPVPGQDNSETQPDRTGNPDLKPELATGVDLAYERYLSGGGMLSVSVFRREITDLIRTVTSAVTQSDGSVRYVSMPQNIGKAMTQGIELEAKFRLAELMDDAPAVDLRANASLYNSKVDSVAGPNNRLDQQAAGALNLGADYKLPGMPLTIGGNVNWQPGYTTRLSERQFAKQNAKRVLDAYAMYQVSPTMRLRLSASNLGPREVETASIVGDETATTTSQSYVNWRLALEMKL